MNRLQFSLRLVLLIVTLLAIIFAWRRIATDAFHESNRDQIEYVKLQLSSLEAAQERMKRTGTFEETLFLKTYQDYVDKVHRLQKKLIELGD